MKIDNYQIVRTIVEQQGLSVYAVVDQEDQKVSMMRLIDREQVTPELLDAWYGLYEQYELAVSNYKHLPRVATISHNPELGVYSLLDLPAGNLLQPETVLTRAQVEQLIDAVAHLHAKGLVHGAIRPENIWLAEEGKVVLYGALEWQAFGKTGLTEQSDFEQLLDVLMHFSDLESAGLRQLQASARNRVADILPLLQEPLRAGLVEKEKQLVPVPDENFSPNQQEQPSLQNQQEQPPTPNQQDVFLTQKHFKRWIFGGAAAAVVLLAVAAWVGFRIGGRQAAIPASATLAKATQPAPKQTTALGTITEATPAPSPAPVAPVKNVQPFDQTALDQLAPGWYLRKSQVIHFADHDVTVAGIADPNSDGFTCQVKILVLRSDAASGSWSMIWQSESSMTEGSLKVFPDYPDVPIESIFVTQSASQKTGLAVVTVNAGGNSGSGIAYALTVDENGNCQMQEQLSAIDMSTKQQGNTIQVSGDQGFGLHQLTLQGEQYVDSKTETSDISPSGAVKVAFKLDQNGNVVPAQPKMLTMKVGQTIAFVPADEQTRQEFNQGKIMIYSDAWNGPPVGTFHADQIQAGNSYTFTKSGVADFLLVDDSNDVSPMARPTPTFTVNVQP